ncbi:ATP-dependent metallopeptidase FtsH/Yme1/Tma family protein, partial [Planktothrix sp. FACHB-1355]
MKFSWRVVLLWTLPALVIGFFLWQGAFATSAIDASRNTASTRMTYGRFLDYLDSGRVTSVDLYEGGRTAIVEGIDPQPELSNQLQRWRVDLPANAPELISKFKEEKVSFAIHPIRND